MTVTKTDLQRTPGKVFRRVARGEAVTVTEHGEGIAVIRPRAAVPGDLKAAAAGLRSLTEADCRLLEEAFHDIEAVAD